MNRPLRASALLAAACCLLACGNEVAPVVANGGTPGIATGGAGAASGGGGAGGASGSAVTMSGSGGQSPGGSGGAGGASGTAGASGSAGAGGDSNLPMLPKRVLLYHFSTAVIDTVPAQLTFYKNLLMTWGYEV